MTYVKLEPGDLVSFEIATFPLSLTATARYTRVYGRVKSFVAGHVMVTGMQGTTHMLAAVQLQKVLPPVMHR